MQSLRLSATFPQLLSRYGHDEGERSRHLVGQFVLASRKVEGYDIACHIA